MKIAVYTICKNEEKFLERFLTSCKNADHILVVDTGSTDKTTKFLNKAKKTYKNLEIQTISIQPWRFDTARNVSLALLPIDIDVCVCLDVDEILTDGWREVIERTWTNKPETTRLRYDYVWSWKDGEPAVTYHADKIHTRHGYMWKSPVHETLARDERSSPEVQTFVDETLIHHHPDETKSRSSYLPLMEMAVKENPNDERMLHYLGREYMFYGEYEKAITHLERHLEIVTWASEKAASLRFIGRCYWALGKYNDSVQSHKKAAFTSPNEREGWVELAQAYRVFKKWGKCLEACNNALKITKRPNLYINEPIAWSDWPETMKKEAEKELENDRNSTL